MTSTTKKLTAAAVAALSVQLVFLLAAAPAYAISTPVCTGTATIGSNTYTLSLSPCSPSGVALNTAVTATASTTDTTINEVGFHFFTPSGPEAGFSPVFQIGSSPFSSGAQTLNLPGTWIVTAWFYSPISKTTAIVTVDVSVQILVLNDLPLGTIAAASIALVGLVAVRRLSKTFTTVTPAR